MLRTIRRPRPDVAHIWRGAGAGSVSAPPSLTSTSTLSPRAFQWMRTVRSASGEACRRELVTSSVTTSSASPMTCSLTSRAARSRAIASRTRVTVCSSQRARIVRAWPRPISPPKESSVGAVAAPSCGCPMSDDPFVAVADPVIVPATAVRPNSRAVQRLR